MGDKGGVVGLSQDEANEVEGVFDALAVGGVGFFHDGEFVSEVVLLVEKTGTGVQDEVGEVFVEGWGLEIGGQEGAGVSEGTGGNRWSVWHGIPFFLFR